MAYSSYVHQYSSGKFDNALFHAERAIGIITHILPEDHLLLASSKRVKALILEEIAIDCHNKETEQRLLQEAHDLHLSSLQLAKKLLENLMYRLQNTMETLEDFISQ